MTPGQMPSSSRARVSTHLVVMGVMMLLSIAFYWPALNNPFWHAEDFRFLERAQDIAQDPQLLLHQDVAERHHPVPLALFLAEYLVFGLQPLGYYVVNLLLHGLNAFLVYWLVAALLADRRIAILSGVLFVFGVGSYGKAVMFVGGAENLLITGLYLLILNLYIRNDIWQQGRIWTVRYILVLLLFLAASYAKPTAFSLVLGLLAYKVFFRGERGRQRKVLEPNLVILVVGALTFWAVREATGVVDFRINMAGRTPWDFAVNFVANMMNYIIHMFFPIHVSQLVTTSNPVVRAIYDIAPVVRVFLGICLVSYGLFGFVFGNRTIRFFLAWTLISVLPYCAVRFPEDWLNIRYLYQVSIGFCFIMASGTVLSMDLLHRRRWRRFVPYIVPAAFVALSGYIGSHLDDKYESQGRAAESVEWMDTLQAREAREAR
ncbi:MAG: hypothetical protein HKO53_15240 [Gemmatimonadetes bacterium]|nr:hypothetical protein [Gemmatimonadota bacterium]